MRFVVLAVALAPGFRCVALGERTREVMVWGASCGSRPVPVSALAQLAAQGGERQGAIGLVCTEWSCGRTADRVLAAYRQIRW
jgi:hypothetical protein